MAYAIYLRKSRADLEAEAHGEGETLSRHKDALLSLASRLHLPIEQVYSEIVSGDSIASRPQMQQLLLDVENNRYDGVLVMDIDRLARGDTIDQGIVAQTFRNSSCKIITPSKTYDPTNEFDEEYFEFGLFMARREYKAINRRIQRGRQASIQEGKFIGSVAPYGYDRIKLEGQKGYTLTPNDNAKVVKKIFSLFVHGEILPDGSVRKLGTTMISRHLNELHIPSAGGKSWTGQMVRTLLQNPTYMGKIRWGYRPYHKQGTSGQAVRHKKKLGEYTLTNGLHEALISEETFYLAQELLKQSKSFPLPYDYTLKNPLSGIVICGLCGHAMVRRYSKRDQQTYMLCTYQTCNNMSSHFELVENYLLQSMENWLLKYKMKIHEEAPTLPDQTAIQLRSQSLNRLNNELRTLETQQDNLYNLLEQGVYTVEVFKQRSATLSSKISQFKSAIVELEQAAEDEEQHRREIEEFIPRFEHALDFYRTSDDIQAKNDLMKEVLEKAVYIKRTGGRWGDPNDFELSIFPRLSRFNYHIYD